MTWALRLVLVLCVVGGLGSPVAAQGGAKVDFAFAEPGITVAELAAWWGLSVGREIAAPTGLNEAGRRVRVVGAVGVEREHVDWFFQSLVARMGFLVVSEGVGAEAPRRLVSRWVEGVTPPLVQEATVGELRRRPAELLRVRVPHDPVRLSELQRLMPSMLCQRGVEVAAATPDGKGIEITARGGTLALILEILAAVDGGGGAGGDSERAATLVAPRLQVTAFGKIAASWKELLARSSEATGRRFAFGQLPHAPPVLDGVQMETGGGDRELGGLMVANGQALLATGPPEGELYWLAENRVSRQILVSATFVGPEKLEGLAARPAEPFVTAVRLEKADPEAAVRALSEKLDQITTGRVVSFGSRRALVVFALGHQMPEIAAVLASLER